MEAKDIMTTAVVTVEPKTSVAEIAARLLDRHVSGIPVVEDRDRVVGIVSEGDLMRRPESGTEGHRSWWLAFLTLPEDDQRRYVKTHGRYAQDVMTRNVVTVPEDCPLDEIAALLEKHQIKRVPVVRDGRLVGIVSRADLLRGLAASKLATLPSLDDRGLREAVEAAVREQAGAGFIGVYVTHGVVSLWGGVETPSAKDAARVAAETVPGVRAVEDHLTVFPPDVRAVLWAE